LPATTKPVLVIGNLQSFKRTIDNLLLNGFRIYYAPTISQSQFGAIIDEVGLIILDIQTSQSLNIKGLPVPVIIVSGNGFGDVLDAYFLKGSQMPSARAVKVRDEMEHIFFGRSGFEPLSGGRLALEEWGGFSILQFSENHRPSLNEGVSRALDYMGEHYFENISLGDITRAACLSRYHFCRLFKRQLGITPISYLSQLRVEKAKLLLRNTSHSVTQICFAVGFNDLSHFERVFRSLAGITPSTYRRNTLP